MKTHLIGLMVAISAGAANASVVECRGEVDGKTETISVKLHADGKLGLWSETQIASTAADGAFGLFAENPEDGEGPFEYLHSTVTSYGMKVLVAGTTADEVKLAVNRDLKRGYFAYRDLGSGNGNQYIPLRCEVLP